VGSNRVGAESTGGRHLRGESPLVFLSAGESSGDKHGAALAKALRERIPGVRLAGMGGPRMAGEGVRLLAELDDLAVMGFAEVARRLPFFARLRRQVRRFIVEDGVDLLIPIDYPGFNLPLSEFAHGRGVPVLYYIAPQVWAWKEGRARRLGAASNLVCTILPFEEMLLVSYGARARFVGHPLLDQPPARNRAEGATLALFPGSRAQELHRMLADFADAAQRVRAERPDVQLLIGRDEHLPVSSYAAAGDIPVVPADEAIASATAAITKSGTITLQLAIAGVPMAVGYRTSRLTYRIARRLVAVPHISLVNLVAGREVVPEHIQDEMTPAVLAESVLPLLDEAGGERANMLTDLEDVRLRLGEPGVAARVADAAQEVLGGS